MCCFVMFGLLFIELHPYSRRCLSPKMYGCYRFSPKKSLSDIFVVVVVVFCCFVFVFLFFVLKNLFY